MSDTEFIHIFIESELSEHIIHFWNLSFILFNDGSSPADNSRRIGRLDKSKGNLRRRSFQYLKQNRILWGNHIADQITPRFQVSQWFGDENE